MTVLDILKTASIYLNLDTTLSSMFSDTASDESSEESEVVSESENNSEVASDSEPSDEQAIFAKLLTSFNEMVGYICANHFDIIDRRDITFDENGTFDVSDLPYRIKKVISLVSDGRQISYRDLGNIICASPSLPVTITYAFIPEELTEHDDFDFGVRVDIGTLALGVAWFYSLNCAIYDDAQLFKEQFLYNLSQMSPVRSVRTKQRRWE